MDLYVRLRYFEREEISRCFAGGGGLREAARRIRESPLGAFERVVLRQGFESKSPMLI